MTYSNLFIAIAAATLFAAPAAAQRFEEPKTRVPDFSGVTIKIGADFAQTYQSLSHSTTSTVPANGLAKIGAGFNLAAANLNLTAQLSSGVKVVLENYMSSRHHNEFWVKGGYLQIEESPIKWEPLQVAMAILTIKAGHYEVNYGDAHFRRTDNGNGMRNPFVENLLLDAFTTEIGGEAIARIGPFLGVAGITNGQNKGDISDPEARSWAFVTKLGADHQFSDKLRARLTGSSYINDNAGRATLYSGDRAGSAYWGVMENAATFAAGTGFTNGRLNPNFTEEITALQLNPYVEFGDIEVFGVIERAKGRTLAEKTTGSAEREVTQYAVDGVYRFLKDQLYVGGRFNTVKGEMLTAGTDQSADRMALAAGWFMTPNVLLKGEYVKQTYSGFPTTSVLNGGKFDGFVIQGLVSF
jgi:hypothetical protein